MATITGVKGNDFVVGTSDDTYSTSFTGLGKKVLVGIDTLNITASGFTESKVTTYKNGTDLVLTYNSNNADSITIADFFNPNNDNYNSETQHYVLTYNGDNKIEFQDGDVIERITPSGNVSVADYIGSATYLTMSQDYINHFTPANFATNSANTYQYIVSGNVTVGMLEFNASGEVLSEYNFYTDGADYTGGYDKTVYGSDVDDNAVVETFEYSTSGQLVSYEKEVGCTLDVSGVDNWNIADNATTTLTEQYDLLSGYKVYTAPASGDSAVYHLNVNNVDGVKVGEITASFEAMDDFYTAFGGSGATGPIQYLGLDAEMQMISEGDPVGDPVTVMQSYYDQYGNLVCQKNYDYDDTFTNLETVEMITYNYDSDGVLLAQDTNVYNGLPIDDEDAIVSYEHVTYNYFDGQLVSLSIEDKNAEDNIINYTNNISSVMPVNGLYTGTAVGDSIVGTISGDTVNGGLGNDYLLGNGGNDTIDGGAGTDIIYGDIGLDSIGGSGNDSLVGGAGDDTIYGGLGTDKIYGGADKDLLYGNDGADTISGGDGADIIFGDTDSDSSIDNGNDLIDGGAGNDTIDGGTGLDSIMGGDGDDYIDGGKGNYNDTLAGGKGNDTYIVNAGCGTDLIVEIDAKGKDTGGIDTIKTNYSNYTLATNVENLIYTDTSSFTGVGNAANNVITGAYSSNLSGLAGNDTLNGAAGNDTLDGGLGKDSLVGGGGDDTYIMNDTVDIIVDSAGEDTILTALTTYTLTAGIENLTYSGSSAFTGSGNSLANIITGSTGNDTLDGGAGDDTLNGGNGDDVFIVDTLNDIVVAGGGIDTVKTSISYNLSGGSSLLADIENITLTGTANIDATGNAANNIITGNAGNNIIDGGSGADTMVGGKGNDTYIVDDAGDVVTDTAGIDTVRTKLASYSLVAGIENFTWIVDGSGPSELEYQGNDLANIITGGISKDNRLYGFAGNDSLRGGDNSDTLDGGTGNDTLIGYDGDDKYYVDSAKDVIIDTDGEDEVITTLKTYTLADGIETLTFVNPVKPSSYKGYGNGLDNTITGTDGKDIIDGKAGADYMIGGAGDDTYYVDSTLDYIEEDPAISAKLDLFLGAPMPDPESDLAPGNDTAIVSVSGYTLADNVENMKFSSTVTSGLYGTGNDLDNNITGSKYSDTIDGGLGADIMSGGQGNDIYYVDDVADVVKDASGIDEIRTALTSYTLVAGIENLTAIVDGSGPSGSSALALTGNALANIITGSNDSANYLSGLAGNDTLVAGSGDDTLIGGIGNDSLDGGVGDDTYVFSSKADGNDIINDGIGNIGDNTVLFDSSSKVKQSDIAILLKDNKLYISYGTGTSSQITVNTGNGISYIETVVDSKSIDVATVVQDMATYASENGLDLSAMTIKDVRANDDLMTIIQNSGNMGP